MRGADWRISISKNKKIGSFLHYSCKDLKEFLKTPAIHRKYPANGGKE